MAEFNNLDIAEKADRLLFAEDLVSYISLKFYGINYTDVKVRGREFSVNLFNDTVKKVVDFIKWQNEKMNPLSFEIIGPLCEIDKHYYKTFVREVLNHFAEDRLEVDTFLYLSVYFVDLALWCYSKSGTEMLDFAVYSILDTFAISADGWMKIHSVAKDILTLIKYENCPDCIPADVDPKIVDAEKSVCKNIEFDDEMECSQNNFMKQESCSVKDNEKLKISSERDDCLTATTKHCSCKKVKHFCENDIEYFKDLALEIELLVSYEASLFSAAFLSVSDTLEDFDFNFDNLIIPENENLTLNVSSNPPGVHLQEIEERNITENIENNRQVEDVHLEQRNGKSITKHFQISDKENLILNDSSSLTDVRSQETEKEIIAKNVTANQINEDAYLEQYNGKSQETEKEIITKNVTANQIIEDAYLEQYNGKSQETEKEIIAKNITANQIIKDAYLQQYNGKSIEENNAVENSEEIIRTVNNDKTLTDMLISYKPEWNIDGCDFVLLKADRLLFAEDLVRYISKEFYGIPYQVTRIEENRSLLFSAFNETVKQAVNVIHRESEIMDRYHYEIIKKFSKSNKCNYRKFIARVLNHYSGGLNAGLFLYLCVYFIEIALKCYSSSFPEILDFAVYSVLDCFCILTGEWLDLNNIAGKIVKLYRSITLYPDCQPSLQEESRILNKVLDCADSIAWDFKAFPSNELSDSKKTEVDKSSSDNKRSEDILKTISLTDMKAMETCIQVQSKNEKNIASSNNNGKSDLFPTTKCSEKSDLSNELNDCEIKFLNDLALEARLIVNFEAAMSSAVFLSCVKVETPRLLTKMSNEAKEKLVFFEVEVKDLVAKDGIAKQKCEITDTDYTKLQTTKVYEQEKINEMDSSSSSSPVVKTNQIVFSSCDPNNKEKNILEKTTEDLSKTEDRSSLAFLSNKPELFGFVYVPTSSSNEGKDKVAQ